MGGSMYSDLRSKLQMYKSMPESKTAHSPKRGPDIDKVIQGTVCGNEEGSYFVIENRYSSLYLHGGYNMGCILDHDINPVTKACTGVKESVDIRKLAFLDTETTGLSGGVGTVAFLIGIGIFEGDTFVLRQYFMRDYDEEYPMLKAVNALLSSYKGLVTFNGKSFDWNLLQTRFTANRLRPLLKDPLHFDLLYPSRMLWKLSLESCRLSSLEEHILGEYRTDDIPGAMIPGIYFKYLDDRNAGDIKKVITHNEKDILSMVSLMTKINSLLGNPEKEATNGWELLGAGRIFEKHDEGESAINCFEQSSLSDNSALKELSLKKLAHINKRNKNYEKAVSQLKLIIEGSQTPNIPVMIELSKHYEHRLKDIPKALEVAQQAVDACLRAGFLRNMYYDELKNRLERLRRKSRLSGNTPRGDADSIL